MEMSLRWLILQCAAKTGFCFRVPELGFEHGSEIVERFRAVRPKRERFFNQLDGGLVLAALMGAHAQKVQRAEMVGVLIENPLVDLACAGDIPGTV
jgi:hypothetical protein